MKGEMSEHWRHKFGLSLTGEQHIHASPGTAVPAFAAKMIPTAHQTQSQHASKPGYAIYSRNVHDCGTDPVVFYNNHHRLVLSKNIYIR